MSLRFLWYLRSVAAPADGGAGAGQTLTSVQAAGRSLAGRPLELGSGPVDQGARLPRLRLRPAAVAEFGAQRQEPALRDGLGGGQPGNHTAFTTNHTASVGRAGEEKLKHKLQDSLHMVKTTTS